MSQLAPDSALDAVEELRSLLEELHSRAESLKCHANLKIGSLLIRGKELEGLLRTALKEKADAESNCDMLEDDVRVLELKLEAITEQANAWEDQVVRLQDAPTIASLQAAEVQELKSALRLKDLDLSVTQKNAAQLQEHFQLAQEELKVLRAAWWADHMAMALHFETLLKEAGQRAENDKIHIDYLQRETKRAWEALQRWQDMVLNLEADVFDARAEVHKLKNMPRVSICEKCGPSPMEPVGEESIVQGMFTGDPAVPLVSFEEVQGDCVEVRPSELSGYGVFATAAIGKGMRLFPYLGEKLTREQANTRDAAYQLDTCHGFIVDAMNSRHVSRFVNHSRDHPNAKFTWRKGKVWVQLLRRLDAGEEILCDYGNRDPEAAIEEPWLDDRPVSNARRRAREVYEEIDQSNSDCPPTQVLAPDSQQALPDRAPTPPTPELCLDCETNGPMSVEACLDHFYWHAVRGHMSCVHQLTDDDECTGPGCPAFDLRDKVMGRCSTRDLMNNVARNPKRQKK